MALLTPLVARAYVSVRRDQTADPLRARFAQIEDALEEIGPIAGILAAQARHPEAAWLVLACDLPFLDARTLAHLIARARCRRDRHRLSLAATTACPEPLCAIYEPRSHALLERHVAHGRHCPRRFLRSIEARLLEEPDPRALDNINTRAEYAAASGTLQPEEPMTVRHADGRVLRAAARAGRAARGRAAERGAHAAGAVRGARAALSVHAAARSCCAWRSTPSSPTGGSRSPRAMPSCSCRRWRVARDMPDFRFTRSPIDGARLARALADPGCGGFAAFEGWVRDHNEGRRVAAPGVRGLRGPRAARGRAHPRGSAARASA